MSVPRELEVGRPDIDQMLTNAQKFKDRADSLTVRAGNDIVSNLPMRHFASYRMLQAIYLQNQVIIELLRGPKESSVSQPTEQPH